MEDIVLHTGYNVTRIDYSKNKDKDTMKLVANHVASAMALSVLLYELLRFIKINYKFMSGTLGKKYKKLKIQKFRKLKKMIQDKKEGKTDKKDGKDEEKSIELTEEEKQILEKDEEDLDDFDLNLIGDITMSDSDFEDDLSLDHEVPLVPLYDEDEK
jgi:hypothetical protein